MRIILALLLALALPAQALKSINEIDKNIQSQEKKQQSIDRERANLNLKLGTLGQNINKNLDQLSKLDRQIQELAKNIELQKDKNRFNANKLQGLEKQLLDLNQEAAALQQHLSQTILRYMTYSQVLDDEEVFGLEDMMTKQAFRLLKRDMVAKLAILDKRQAQLLKSIDDTHTNIKEVTQIIATQENKHKNLQIMIGKQKDLVANMRDELRIYNKRMRDIDAQKRELDQLLSKLNILKKNTQEEIKRKEEAQRRIQAEKKRLAELEKEKKKKEEEKRKAELARNEAKKKAEAEAKKIAQKDSKQAQEFLKVQNATIDSNYQAALSKQEAALAIDDYKLSRVDGVYMPVSTVAYSGKKTNPPLKSYAVEQPFGDYEDPVYKIKLFSSGIVLKPKGEDSQVYNIMDGKVVYAQEIAGLKTVVIIEHDKSIYTIYSLLDKIPPTIKEGFVIKQGYVIGRVNDRLNLEIIQNNKHINPKEVIR